MKLFILITSEAMKKSKSSEEAWSIFEQLFQEPREKLRMKYERFKNNMPPVKQKAADEVVNIFLGKGLKEYYDLKEILDPVINLLKLYLQLFLIFFIFALILPIPSLMMLVPYIPFLCMFAIFFFSKYAKSFKLLELFRNLKIKIKWKLPAGIKWEIIKTFLIGFTSLVLYIIYKDD